MPLFRRREKVDAGLKKTRQAFFGRIAGLLSRSTVDEELWEELEEALISADAGAKQLHIMPVGLYGPEHVANTVTFICSDAAAYISGDVFDIAAGRNTEFPA